jgi:flagellar basal body-associated protein FliL
MKTTLKILIIVLILIILVVSAFLIISLLSANPYKTEIRYKPLALQSINYEIPDFWREYVEEPQVYYTR